MTLTGQYLGHYHVLRQIGRGGMGEVYLAEDSHVTRQVAIKVVRNEQVAYPDYTMVQETTRLFQREMKSISLLDHSHILNIYDFGEEKVTGGSLVYMVMPYRPEGSLEQKREAAAYVELTDQLEALYESASPYHQLLGHPYQVQGDLLLECQRDTHSLGDPANWQLLLQVDSDDNAHMMWGDVGVLYFYIPQLALITHDFAQAHLIMQCG